MYSLAWNRIFSRCAGSSTRLRRVSRSASFSFEGRMNPVFPGSKFSLGPTSSVTTTGSPEAWASSTTFPKVSVVEGKMKMSLDA